MSDSRRTFYEFFAGGGMARLGLGEGWRCLLANDNDAKKAESYVANFGGEHFDGRDVHALTPADLPERADLAWASFPCQDLSLAGQRMGLGAGASPRANRPGRSAAFYGFWELMCALDDEGRAPRLIVLENVIGLISSRGGADFAALCALLASRGYRFGALEVDAARFVPQSRPRLFVVAQKADGPLDPALVYPEDALSIPSPFHSPAIRRAAELLEPEVAQHWVWWRLPEPPAREAHLGDLLETRPDKSLWFTASETQALLGMMSSLHMERVWTLQEAGGVHVGAVYRRMRSVNGRKVQRAEARFDGLAGCLRTPGGGSSRQFLLIIDRLQIRARRMSKREAARLMGLPDSYRLPASETASLYLTGDGVAVPCVAHLAQRLLDRLLASGSGRVAA